MRSLWTLIVAFVAGTATGGGAVYVFQSSQPAVAAAPANPLLTANRAAMLRLVPNFFAPCGRIVFEDATTAPSEKERCVDEIKTSVWHQEQVRLTEADVLDPRVRAQWLKVVRGK